MNYFDYFWRYTLSFKGARMMQFSWTTLLLALILGLISFGLAWKVSACTDENCAPAIFLGTGVFALTLLLAKLFDYIKRLIRYKFVRISFIFTISGLILVGFIIWKELFPLTTIAAVLLILGGLLNAFGFLKTLGHFKGKTFIYLANDRMWVFPKTEPWILLVAIDRQEEKLESFLWNAFNANPKMMFYTGKEGQWALSEGEKREGKIQQSYVPQLEAALDRALHLKEETTVLIVDLEGGAYWVKVKEFKNGLAM